MNENESKYRLIQNIRHFNRYYTNLLELLNRRRFDSPYSLAEARVLLEISQMEHCTASRLKDLLRIDFGYLSRIIRRLLQDGVISEERSPHDGRSRFLILTVKGGEILNYIHESSNQQVHDMIRHLSHDELGELVCHMKAIEKILSDKSI